MSSARLWYGDRDAATDRAALRSRIGLVPQDDVLHHALTVEQELRHAATLRFAGDTTEAELARRVDEVIAELDLAEVRHLRIDRLSGGQRKRVSVGIELLTRPALLFLDEPTSGLDPGYERALMQLLRRLADGGRVVVVITHAVASIRLCDRLLMLAPGGRTAFFGPAQFAPEYFGTGDLEEVFHLLSEHDEIDWAGRYRASSFHERYVGDVGPGAPAVPMRVAPLPHDRLRQFRTLLRRNRQVLTADRRNLITLLAQGPVLGLVLLVALPPGELDAPALFELRVASRSSLVLLLIVLGATWLGSIVAVRSIADEAVILRREHAAGLSLGAYIGAKAVVLGSVTVAAVVPMAVVATLRQGGPDGAAVLGLPTLELVVAVALTALAAMAQAMLLSAVVPTGDRAMSLLPALLILQMVLAVGAVFPEVTDGPGLDQLTVLSSAYWGMAAVGATADLNALQGLTVALSELPPLDLLAPEATLEAIIATIGAAAAAGDPRFEPRAEVWLANAGASVAIGAVALVLAHVSLRRRLAR